MGRLREGSDALDRALALAREAGELELVGWLHCFLGDAAKLIGDEPAAASHARQELEIAEQLGHPGLVVDAYARLATAPLLGQRWPEAVVALEQARDLIRTRFSRWYIVASPLEVSLAEAYAALGHMAKARRSVEEALANAGGSVLRALHAQLTLARLLLHPEVRAQREEVDAAIEKALTPIRETGASVFEPRVHELWAEQARIGGDGTTRHRELREAHRLFTEMGATGHAERLAKELGKTKVPKRKPVAQKPRAKGKAKVAKPSRRAKSKPVCQTARRKSKK
jgi:tetratricopeptide (TPR) repeat protein